VGGGVPDEGLQLARFGEIENKERYDPKARRYFKRLLYALWTTGIDSDAVHSPVKRGDIVDMVGCSPQYVSERLRVLKTYSLIESSRHGYVKQPKFMRLTRRLLRDRPEYFNDMADEPAAAGEGDGDDLLL